MEVAGGGGGANKRWWEQRGLSEECWRTEMAIERVGEQR